MASVLSGKGETVNGVNLVVANRAIGGELDPNMLREAALTLQKSLSNTAIVSASESAGKPQLLLMYSADLLAAGRNAGNDIREAAKLIQGGGGGQPGIATAGGKNIDGLKAALDKLIELATR